MGRDLDQPPQPPPSVATPLEYPATKEIVDRVRTAAARLPRELAPAHVFQALAPPKRADGGAVTAPPAGDRPS